jgi:hypothetical protein
VTIPATVPQGSEIPEGLMNNSVYVANLWSLLIDSCFDWTMLCVHRLLRVELDTSGNTSSLIGQIILCVCVCVCVCVSHRADLTSCGPTTYKDLTDLGGRAV